jgi:hypothetical protein
MASTSGANTAPGSRTRSRSPVNTKGDRDQENSASVSIEDNSASNSFTSTTKKDAAEEVEHERMRHSVSLIHDEEPESKEHEDIPVTASHVTELHLEQERFENDSYFDDHHYQTGTNDTGMLSPESQGTDEDDFIKRIYETTVDGTCQGGFSGCQMSIDQQLDLFTHCRQPLAFLSLFREHGGNTRDGVESLPVGMGMYVMPTFCEYCGAEHTNDCTGNCQRPALYLQKKRPPFSKPSRALWDPATDHAIPQKRDKNSASQGRQSSPLRQTQSWVSGLFGKEK